MNISAIAPLPHRPCVADYFTTSPPTDIRENVLHPGQELSSQCTMPEYSLHSMGSIAYFNVRNSGY